MNEKPHCSTKYNFYVLFYPDDIYGLKSNSKQTQFQRDVEIKHIHLCFFSVLDVNVVLFDLMMMILNCI